MARPLAFYALLITFYVVVERRTTPSLYNRVRSINALRYPFLTISFLTAGSAAQIDRSFTWAPAIMLAFVAAACLSVGSADIGELFDYNRNQKSIDIPRINSVARDARIRFALIAAILQLITATLLVAAN